MERATSAKNDRAVAVRSRAARTRRVTRAILALTVLAAPPALAQGGGNPLRQLQYAWRDVERRVSGVLGETGGVVDQSGGVVDQLVGTVPGPAGDVLRGPRPRVVGAVSKDNVTVVVSFSKAMGTSATDPTNYSIVQENVNPEVGALGVTAAEFVDSSRQDVRLTTRSQNEVTYRVKVSGVKDRYGQPLADPAHVNDDPRSATFAGTPPSGGGVDSDGDGLTDSEEQLGWPVTIQLADGRTVRREVTSNPDLPDTDGDGLDDFTEKTLSTDPRDGDTDDDGLGDFAEFNEIFSQPAVQDTDGDGLTDGLEVDFFRTSALLTDTDGDQLPDGDEVNFANRNPRVADLPQPSLEIGEMNLQLDVRFVEVTATETKEVEAKTVDTKLTQSSSREFQNGGSTAMETSVKVGTTTGVEIEASSSPSVKGFFSVTEEKGFTHTTSTNWSETSRQETAEEYARSLQTSAEVTEGATVTREVTGARMQVAVVLKNLGDIAFTLKNLQVVALIQDPQNPTNLRPIATLLPDSEPEGGYNLGPLVPERGPIIFSNEQIFPNLVESLMRNPRGLVFRFSNFDMTDELGRNFAFSSQDVTDRTTALTIDFGGEDLDGDGVGDFSAEIVRAATGVGRRLDTNGDGRIDDRDRIVVFDANGKQVGITLRDALAAHGLTEYDETETPTDSLTPEEVDSSYSVLRGENGFERIFRIRRTLARTGEPKMWAIVTSRGIDDTKKLDDYVLKTGSFVSLAFLQDLDRDGLPALVEALNNCSDNDPDTDGDGLDDRFETLVGWEVDLGPRGRRRVFSSCSSPDTDGDGLTDLEEAPAILERDDRGRIRFDPGHEPRRDDQGLPPPEEGDSREERVQKRLAIHLADPITDPAAADTDGDGIDDFTEIHGYDICHRDDECPPDPFLFTDVRTSPELFDTDEETASDGLEKRLGGNPVDPNDFDQFGDSDGDGLVNVQETDGWMVTIRGVSTVGTPGTVVEGRNICDGVCADGAPTTYGPVRSRPDKVDTDGDGLSDAEEFRLRTDPTKADTDGDGLTDFEEVRGYAVRDLGILVSDPTDRDTDDDKLSDWEEARGPRYVVRVAGETPYESFSNPLDPDTDLDRLVDGDEKFSGADPALANTDGDPVLDYEEVIRQSRPAVPDLQVRATLEQFVVDRDCDAGGAEAGEFRFEFGFTLPDGSERILASSNINSPNWVGITDFCDRQPDDSQARVCKDTNSEDIVFITSGGAILRMGRSVGPFGLSTTPAVFEEFSLAGFWIELDRTSQEPGPHVLQEYPDFSQETSGAVAGDTVSPGSRRLEVPFFDDNLACDVRLKFSYTAR